MISALELKGYAEHSYYTIPGGFAVATRIERIDPTGAPLTAPDRWSLSKVPLRTISMTEWARALFSGQPGYYRVIVFVVTNVPIMQRSAQPTSAEAKYWLLSGMNILPPELSNENMTADYSCTALIYEFERDMNRGVVFISDGLPDARTQLKNTGLWSAFMLP
jgi:hypothetical protein